MQVALITVPYHLGRANVSLGAGVPLLAEALAELAPERVVHVGGRDLDPEEERRFAASPIARVRPGEALGPKLDALAERAGSVYLHVDLDVLDPGEGRANDLAVPGGLTVADV